MTEPASVHRIARFSIVSLAVMLYASAASAQPSLGTAGNFGALGATTVTNTGPTVVTGDVGVSPGTAITGFPPGTATGTIHRGGPVAARAHADAFMANEELKAMACDTMLTGQNLGGMTLAPGVYCFTSSAQLTGRLVLTGEGPWVFKIVSTLTTASNSSVLVPDATTACSGANVFWQVGSSATLGTGTAFAGNILATASITATTGVSVSGSLLAINAAVTLDRNRITACGAGGVPPDPDPDPDDCKDHRGKCKCKCKCRDHRHDGDRDDHDRGDHRNCNRHDDDHDRGDHRNCDRHDGHHDRDDHDGDRGDRDHRDNDRDHDKNDKDHDSKNKNDKGWDGNGRK